MAPQCPHYTPVRVVTVPIFKTFTIPASASAKSWFAIFAPLNDWLGQVYYQGVATPDNTTTIVGWADPGTDASITSALAPYVDVGVNFGGVPQCRATEFCVEVACSQALASVAGALRVGRWQNGGVGLVGAETPAQFFVANEQFRVSEPEVMPFADLVSAKCIHTAMRDRTALEFIPLRTGSAQWKNIYGVNDSPSDDSVPDLATVQVELRRMVAGVTGVPWEPLIFQWAGSTTPEVTFTIRGKIELSPPVGTVLYRLAKVPPSPAPDAEAKWWAWSRQLALSKMAAISSGVSRKTAGYVGTSQPKAAQPKPKQKSAPPSAPPRRFRGLAKPATANSTRNGWGNQASVAAGTAAATAAALMPYARDRGWRGQMAGNYRRGRQELR